jgi:hypothetical protein
MKKIALLAASAAVALFAASPVLAAPNNEYKAENNPNVVAYYPYGLHAIPTNPIQYVYGTDLVTTRGNTGQIEAWYTGSDNHGFHSVWNITKDDVCPKDWVLIQHAYPSWGGYLNPGADYCVSVNAF